MQIMGSVTEFERSLILERQAESIKPKCCKRNLTEYARRQACRCSRLPQVPGNEADPVKLRSRRAHDF